MPQSSASPASASSARRTTLKTAASSLGGEGANGDAGEPGGIGRQAPPVGPGSHRDVVVEVGVQHRHVVVVPGPQQHLLAAQHAAFVPDGGAG